MSKSVIIGVDIGGTKISTGLVNLNGELSDVVTLPTKADEPVEVFINQLKSSIDTILDNNSIDISDIKGLGLCCPGPINPKTGQILNPPNLPMLWNTNLKDLVKSLYNLPVKVENDANAAGLAEVMIGAAAGCENVFYVTVSTGVGTGIIINRQIYHGKNGFAGEGGHISTSYTGQINCNCNAPGCIESIASGTAIARRARELVINDKANDSKLINFKNKPDQLSAKDVGKLALEGDPLAKSLIEDSAFHTGAWLGGMINLLDPDMIVIGGGVASIGNMFFDIVRSTALKYTYNMYADKTPIVEAKLKSNVGVYGAASLFMD